MFSDDPVAADATCCRLMGIYPNRVRHLQMASSLGNLDRNRIDQCGESIETLSSDSHYFRSLPICAAEAQSRRPWGAGPLYGHRRIKISIED